MGRFRCLIQFLRSVQSSSFEQFLILLGPTEVTIGCTSLKQVRKGARPSNIGQQFTNCGTFVSSQLGVPKPALRGAIGNLVVSGTQVAEGYIGLPEATARRFGFSDILNARTYDTGDLVRLLEIDYSFDFAGRADSQVKLRGQRIETGEIDSVLIKSNTNVASAVTLVLKHPSQPKETLVSFIVYQEHRDKSNQMQVVENQKDTSAQFQACRETLSTYMVPSYIIPLTRIDLTGTNKVDLRKVQALYNSIDPEHLPVYAPAQVKSQRLADQDTIDRVKTVLRDMTGVHDIGDDVSPFELGLDSVSIVGLVRKLRRAGFNDCTVSLVMTSQDVTDLASALISTDGKHSAELDKERQKLAQFHEDNMESAAEQLSIDVAEVENVIPCTALVEGLIVETIQQGRHVHVNKFGITARDLDCERLRRAYDRLVAQTPVLRSRFVLLPDGLTQIFLKTDLKNEDPSDFPLKTRLVQLSNIIQNGQSQWTLLLHHSLYDGQSLYLLLDDLKSLYESDSASSIDAPDFMPAVAGILALDLVAAQEFWISAMEACTTLSPVRRSEANWTLSRTLSTNVSDLERCSKAYRCAQNIILQAAWSLTLTQLLGDSTVFGFVITGRSMSLDQIDEMRFPMFNTLPVYVDTNKLHSTDSLIETLQKTYGEATQYEHTPLRDIKKWLSIPSNQSLMDCLLVYQREHNMSNIDNGVLQFEDKNNNSAGYAIALDITAQRDGALGLILNIADVGVRVEVIAEMFETILSMIISKHGIEQIRECMADMPFVNVTRRQVDAKAAKIFDETSELRNQESIKNILEVVGGLLDENPLKISLSGSFFAMGIDSIDAIKISARLKKNFGYHVSAGDVLKHSSVRALNGLITSRNGNFGTEKIGIELPANFSEKVAAKLSPVYEVDYILPAAPIQAGMLTTSRHDAAVSYLNHTFLRLQDRIDVDKLIEAWQTMIDSNGILRTSFSSIDSDDLGLQCEYVQIVHKSQPIHVSRMSVALEGALQAFEQHKDSARELCTEDACIPFFLSIIETNSQKFLAISIHHCLVRSACALCFV